MKTLPNPIPDGTCTNCGTYHAVPEGAMKPRQIDGRDNYVVLYRIEAIMSPLDSPFGFQCCAADADHAEEQCLNANPDGSVVWVWQGREGVGMQPALDDYYGNDLVEAVIEQIKHDLEGGDTTALTELLMSCPRQNLESYLPEEGLS